MKKLNLSILHIFNKWWLLGEQQHPCFRNGEYFKHAPFFNTQHYIGYGVVCVCVRDLIELKIPK